MKIQFVFLALLLGSSSARAFLFAHETESAVRIGTVQEGEKLIQDRENKRLKNLIALPQNLPQSGRGVLIAVADTGLNLPKSFAAKKNILPGWNAVENSAQTQDNQGHGTAVTGIILSLAPQAYILPVKMLSQETGDRETLVKAVAYAMAVGADIINVSASTTEKDLIAIRKLVGPQKFAKSLIVISSGNDEGYETLLKEIWPNVIFVAATTLDSQPRLATYSRRGPGIDIAAPSGFIDDGLVTWSVDGGVRTFNGTSASAPVVVAAAALLKEKYPRLTASEIKADLLSSACPAPGLLNFTPDNRFLNVGRLLRVSSTCSL